MELDDIKEYVRTTCKMISPEGAAFSKGHYQCNYENCGVVDEGRRIAEHIMVDHMLRKPQCPTCENLFHRHDVYNRHVKACIKCDHCGKGHGNVKKHKACDKKHNGEENAQNTMPCQFGVMCL